MKKSTNEIVTSSPIDLLYSFYNDYGNSNEIINDEYCMDELQLAYDDLAFGADGVLNDILSINHTSSSLDIINEDHLDKYTSLQGELNDLRNVLLQLYTTRYQEALNKELRACREIKEDYEKFIVLNRFPALEEIKSPAKFLHPPVDLETYDKYLHGRLYEKFAKPLVFLYNVKSNGASPSDLSLHNLCFYFETYLNAIDTINKIESTLSTYDQITTGAYDPKAKKVAADKFLPLAFVGRANFIYNRINNFESHLKYKYYNWRINSLDKTFSSGDENDKRLHFINASPYIDKFKSTKQTEAEQFLNMKKSTMLSSSLMRLYRRHAASRKFIPGFVKRHFTELLNMKLYSKPSDYLYLSDAELDWLHSLTTDQSMAQKLEKAAPSHVWPDFSPELNSGKDYSFLPRYLASLEENNTSEK